MSSHRKEFMGLVKVGVLQIKGKNGLVSPTEASRHKDTDLCVSPLPSASVAVQTGKTWGEKVLASESPGSNVGGSIPEPPSSQVVEEVMQLLKEGGGGGGGGGDGMRNKLVSSRVESGKQWVGGCGPHSNSYGDGLRVDASAPNSKRKESPVLVDNSGVCRPAVIGMESDQLQSMHKPLASLKQPGSSPPSSPSQVFSLHSSSISSSSSSSFPCTPRTPHGGKGSKRTAKASAVINFSRTPSRSIKVEPTASPSPSLSKPEPKGLCMCLHS